MIVWRIIYMANMVMFAHALIAYLAFGAPVKGFILVLALIIAFIYFLAHFLSTFFHQTVYK